VAQTLKQKGDDALPKGLHFLAAKDLHYQVFEAGKVSEQEAQNPPP
jgi:hypothetical protein